MSEHTKKQLARVHAKTVASLPEPPGKFTLQDVDLLGHPRLHRFRIHGVVHVVGSLDPEDPEAANIYTVDEGSYELAQQYVEDRERLSCCGATGVTNDGGDIVCQDCGTEIEEDEFRRVCKL